MRHLAFSFIALVNVVSACTSPDAPRAASHPEASHVAAAADAAPAPLLNAPSLPQQAGPHTSARGPVSQASGSWTDIDALHWPKPQTRIRNHDAAKSKFWPVYANGGTELYCRLKFDSAAAKLPTKNALNIEHAYPADRIAREFGHADRECGKSPSNFPDAKCLAAIADMHNLWPAFNKTNFSRQDLRYGLLPKRARRPFVDEGCPDFLRDRMQKGAEPFVQPTADARGDIARSLIYMSEVYGFPLDGAIIDRDLLLDWHRADPPMRRRNGARQPSAPSRAPGIRSFSLPHDIHQLSPLPTA